MCYGQSSKTPLFYQTYDGSITDKTHLLFILETFPFTSDNKTCFVLDQGFMTKKNLTLLTQTNSKFSVLSFLPKSWKDMKRIVDDFGESALSFNNYLKEYDVYAIKLESTIQEVPMTVHLYYDKARAIDEADHLYQRIFNMEEEIKKKHKSKFNKKNFKDYFIFDIPEGEEINSYERNIKVIGEAEKRCGYFALITSDPSISSREALRAYREKDVIEKTFDDLKNGIDSKRVKTHKQKTTDGKMFISFISLILRSKLYDKTSSYRLENNMTMPKMLNQLNKVRCTVFED